MVEKVVFILFERRAFEPVTRATGDLGFGLDYAHVHEAGMDDEAKQSIITIFVPKAHEELVFRGKLKMGLSQRLGK